MIKSHVLYRLSYGLGRRCVGGGPAPVNTGGQMARSVDRGSWHFAAADKAARLTRPLSGRRWLWRGGGVGRDPRRGGGRGKLRRVDWHIAAPENGEQAKHQ